MTLAKSFVDEDWTGYDHDAISKMILQEYEEQQCKGEGHLWILNIYCKNCGEQFNLEFNLSQGGCSCSCRNDKSKRQKQQQEKK
jgi:hypothetical protein